MDLSERIEQLREAKNIRKADMAKALEMDASYYNKFEKRGNKLTVEQLEKIAEALGVSVLELMTGEPQKVEDTGKVRELEKRVKELEDIIKDKNELIGIRDKRFTDIGNHFTEFLYRKIAIMGYEQGYSQVRYVNYKTGKTIRTVTYEQEKEADTREGMLFQEILPNWKKFVDFAKANKYLITETYLEFELLEEFKAIASYYFFASQFLLDSLRIESYFFVELIMESGLINDTILLFGYHKVKNNEHKLEDDFKYDVVGDVVLDNLESVYTWNVDKEDFNNRIRNEYREYISKNP